MHEDTYTQAYTTYESMSVMAILNLLTNIIICLVTFSSCRQECISQCLFKFIEHAHIIIFITNKLKL